MHPLYLPIRTRRTMNSAKLGNTAPSVVPRAGETLLPGHLPRFVGSLTGYPAASPSFGSANNHAYSATPM
jgi:hypothetical protein